MMTRSIAAVAILGTLFTARLAAASGAQAPTLAGAVVTNDNRRPAGTLADRVLTVRLVARYGEWHPEAAGGPGLNVAAFGEDDGPLLTPGPLLRVSEGTEIVVHVRNDLAVGLEMHGFVTRPSAEDPVFSIPAGEARDIRFLAGAPGTYHYWATTGGSNLNTRKGAESQLGGAFIIDPPGSVAPDRVFVMTEWDVSPVRVNNHNEVLTPDVRRVFAINGLSWPHTERLDERVGQSVSWHIVNLTQAAHPMHLHGFYFSVRAVGTGLRQTTYAPGQYREVVTEGMVMGTTMRMVWTPERAGNWLLHCHLITHVTPALRFWASDVATGGHGTHDAHDAHDATTSMAGLVMGIRVAESGSGPRPVAVSKPARRMTLAMHHRPGYWGPEDAKGFALQTGDRETRPEDATVPGPLLVLTKGQPVEITLKNELPQATAIHWHGIELESYFDGVPGWSGNSASTTPAIVPGAAFVVRFTPPRAGTFIYHTHSHDNDQLASGLYGALVVVEPGEAFDSARDHVVILGMEGTKDTQKYDQFPVIVNGSRKTAVRVKAGVPNRFRLINITTDFYGMDVTVIAANQPVEWRPVAKDGAELPATQQVMRPAFRQRVFVGETYDFVLDSPPPGPMWIELRRASGEWVQQVPVRIQP